MWCMNINLKLTSLSFEASNLIYSEAESYQPEKLFYITKYNHNQQTQAQRDFFLSRIFWFLNGDEEIFLRHCLGWANGLYNDSEYLGPCFKFQRESF